MKAAKTSQHSVAKRAAVPQVPWVLEPVLNQRTGRYSYKYHRKQETQA